MKKYVVIAVVLGCFLTEIYGFPGAKRDVESREDDDKKGVDTVLILPGQNRPGPLDFPDFSLFEDDEDTDGFFDEGYPLRFNPFGGLLESMQNAMNRIRAQMAGVLNHMPGQGSFVPWFKIPEGANTTSTTKIIDGHVVTINETTYSDGDDTHGTVLRVSVIDVKPQNGTFIGPDDNDSSTEVDVAPTNEPDSDRTDNGENTTASRSVETVEDFSNNEIPKNQVDTLTA